MFGYANYNPARDTWTMNTEYIGTVQSKQNIHNKNFLGSHEYN